MAVIARNATLRAMDVEPWLPRAARRRPQARALGTLTYAELDERVRRAAGALGARPGERVAIALPPGREFAVALHACLISGAVAVPVDLRLPDPPLAGATKVVDAPLGDGPPVRPRAHDLGTTAIVVHTSGTTAAPRPVELTFGNWLWSALGSGVAIGTRADDAWLCTLPLSHVGGLSILLRSAIYATAADVHERWDTERALAAIAGGATLVSVVATTLARLLDAGLQDPPRLRCALVGGGPCPPALAERARAAGVAVAQTYGLTEACSQVTTAAPGDTAADAGQPLFCTRVWTEDGEICVRSPTVAPQAGPVLRTGDLGVLDAGGRLTVTGRRSEAIVTGGENVAPAEVESVLEDHPAVAEALVEGRPDAQWGESIAARVVLKPGAEAAEAQLREFCASRLAGFKVPKAIEFVAALPRTASGKLLRRRAS
jgi:O-succinylbenzoic acid--CoA ligase